jgi:competence ComEA-like helix-hairpin-helix protein
MKRFLTAVQQHTGLAYGEAVVVSTITILLLSGWIGQRLFPRRGTHDVVAVERVIALLDSIEQGQKRDRQSAERSSYPESSRVSEHEPLRTMRSSAPVAALKVDVNTANKQTLMKLPGVGPATADRIVETRAITPFANVDELTRVKGIGPKKLEKMRPYVTVP